jgi:DNA-binding ferritin-like protein (Dps family)
MTTHDTLHKAAHTMLDKTLGLQSKKEWRAMKARAELLPSEYRKAFHSMQRYMWTTGVVSTWEESKFVFEQLLDLLEEAASSGRAVTDVTGADVAAFCDELRQRASQDWRDKYRERLNREVGGKAEK